MSEPLRILVIGAHPDDCEYKAGGVAALYRQLGHRVCFVSMTNGESGHHRLRGEELIRVRREEAAAAGRVLGVEYQILGHRDGALQPTLEARFELIALIRRYEPDLILTHRPNDYHPDHRYTSQLVCDSAYMVTVPPIVPEIPALRDNPVIAYLSDNFERPYPLCADIVVDIEPVLETTIDALDCHRSQFYDWLAYNHRYEEQLPPADAGRRAWLGEWFRSVVAPLAVRYRDRLVATYGEERGHRIRYIEAFELSEYGAGLSESERRRLFPFLLE